MTGFIFDMDGTLLDSIKIWLSAEQHILDAAGITLTKDERDELNTLTLEEAGEFFHERFGILSSGEEVVQNLLEYMLSYYRNEVEANPGAYDFVKAVHDAGQPMCVLSSSPQSFLQAGLAHTGMKEFFADDMIISAEDMGMTKRTPETFAKMCEILGTKPADTWLFDDSWYAVQTAHDMGLRSVGTFSSDKCGSHDELGRYADIVVDDFTGLELSRFLS